LPDRGDTLGDHAAGQGLDRKAVLLRDFETDQVCREVLDALVIEFPGEYERRAAGSSDPVSAMCSNIGEGISLEAMAVWILSYVFPFMHPRRFDSG
jgi:hypothetical protein